MAADPSPPDPPEPPAALVGRTAWVAIQVSGATPVGNLLKIPGDRRKDDQARWFGAGTDDVGRPMNPARAGNEVKYLIDGKQAFEEMARVMLQARARGDFIYLANWWFTGAILPLAGSSQTLDGILRDAARAGVLIRALFWDQQFSTQNSQGARDINALATGGAVLDDVGNESLPIINLPYHVGSQHQKILCVQADGVLTAFVGGVDWNPDRIEFHGGGSSSGGAGDPLHDVHCRIRGPAARDVVQTFLDRWNDSSRRRDLPPAKQTVITPALPAPVAGPEGRHVVQIGRTFGTYGYGFAPRGEHTAGELILRAIRNARRFIYTEDQYFVGNDQVRSALAAALPRIQHFTAVITPQEASDLPEGGSHRRDFIQFLRGIGGDKVRIFALDPPHAIHTYVHAKIWIIDDEFVSIGTVNCNRRGYTHDSEIVAGLYETSSDERLMLRLAHWLRIKLWAEHFGFRPWQFTPDRAPSEAELLAYAELADGVASAVHFRVPPAGARIKVYDEFGAGVGHAPTVDSLLWENFADPA
jgi:phosphatidylserine/phosphatidylglycerophosphate/cardiolipin synthase-like enzyme